MTSLIGHEVTQPYNSGFCSFGIFCVDPFVHNVIVVIKVDSGYVDNKAK